MQNTPIELLQHDLTRQFERDPRGVEAARILAAYARAERDWRKFVHFAPDVYTRNLVARNDHYEMLVLCWAAGQASPIHNHAGQNCWMAVLDGEIEETQFEPSGSDRAPRLAATGTKTFTAGRVAFINDEIALHRVRPVAGRAGISLHLYSKPIDVCNLYDEHSGQVVQKRLVYHSIDGRLLASGPISNP